MKPSASSPVGLALLVLLTCAAQVRDAQACAIASFEGAALSLATENVAIIWDAENRRQHFIRDAVFEGDGRDFGFLVPTPSMPELTKSSTSIMESLAGAIRPERETRNEYIPTTCCIMGSGFFLGARSSDDALAVSVASQAGVEVVGTQRIGDLDASILRVNDAEALPAWLKENGFHVAESIMGWAQPYADEGYFITAFKFDPAEASSFQTGAIRISFDAERPFYPYREPQGASPGGQRSLRVYFLADERATGRVGDDEFGSVYFADQATELAEQDALTALGVDEGTWLTVFNDTTSTRPDHDVFFDVAAGSATRPDPIITINTIPIPVPLEIILPLGFVWFWRKRRKRPPVVDDA